MLHEDSGSRSIQPILDWIEQILQHVEPVRPDTRFFAIGRAQVRGLLGELRAAADEGDLALGIARIGIGLGQGPVLVVLGEEGALVAMRSAAVPGGGEPQG